MRVTRAVVGVARHPVHFVLTRWNWKAALISAVMRGALFFLATITSGVAAATRALIVDISFRVPLAGACSAVIQEVRWAEPRWAAISVAVLAVPAVAHALEIATHWLARTPSLWRGVAASLALSTMSSAVELSLMRRDILLVGPGGGSLASDLRRLLQLTRPGVE